MILPEGKKIGVIRGSFAEVKPYAATFTGALEVISDSGEGFVLCDKGTIVAAYIRDQRGTYTAKVAVERLNAIPPVDFALRTYSEEEYSEALAASSSNGWFIPAAGTAGAERQHIPLTEESLQKVLKQPGVHAVSAFYEGFPVQSLGDADFDLVAAMAEDLLRAGTKIAADMKIGILDQAILETAQGKLILAPYGDLYLCVLADANANLGLVRIAVKSIQSEAK